MLMLLCNSGLSDMFTNCNRVKADLTWFQFVNKRLSDTYTIMAPVAFLEALIHLLHTQSTASLLCLFSMFFHFKN